MRNFLEFIDKKEREVLKQLRIVKRVLEKHEWEVDDFTDSTGDPYIFVKAPPKSDLSFDGIRIYGIGNSLAYRIQNEPETQPYGKAYPLEVEEMFTDLISDKMDEEKAGKKVMEAIHEEIKRFFKDSAHAEKALNAADIEKDNDAMGHVMIRSTGTDYGNQVSGKT